MKLRIEDPESEFEPVTGWIAVSRLRFPSGNKRAYVSDVYADRDTLKEMYDGCDGWSYFKVVIEP